MQKQHKHGPASGAKNTGSSADDAPGDVGFDPEVVTVSEVIGKGRAAQRLVRVGMRHELRQFVGLGETEVRRSAIDIGTLLGFARPRDVRKLVDRYRKSGDLPDVYVRATVAHTQMPTGGVRQTKVTEYWLTQDEFLFVVAKSETPIANSILKDMIRVYRLAMVGVAPQPRAANDDVAELRADMRAFCTALPGAIREVFSKTMEAQTKQLGEVIRQAFGSKPAVGPADWVGIGKSGAREIRAELRLYAEAMATPHDKEERRRWMGRGQNELRSVLGFYGTARKWESLSYGDFSLARMHLCEMRKRAGFTSAQQAAVAPPPQMVLPFRRVG